MLWDTPDSLLDEEVIKKPAELDDASYDALVRADFHGVHVGNEHDVRCLVRLLEHVPLHKVIRSVQLQELKWPGRRLYVTKLLKRYHVKAPPRVPKKTGPSKGASCGCEHEAQSDAAESAARLGKSSRSILSNSLPSRLS